MKRKEKKQTAMTFIGEIAGKLLYSQLVACDAYHKQRCLECLHNPDRKIKKEGPEGPNMREV